MAGLSVTQVAAETGAAEGTVKSRLARARAALAAALGPDYLIQGATRQDRPGEAHVTLGDVMNHSRTTTIAARGTARARSGPPHRRPLAPAKPPSAALAVAAAVVAVLAAGAIIIADLEHSAQPIGPIDGWRVARTLHVPGSGGIVYAADAAVGHRQQEHGADGGRHGPGG